MKIDVDNLTRLLNGGKPTYVDLVQPVAWAEDGSEAESVPWQMKQNVEDGAWCASLLGIINGILPEAIGMVLTAAYDDETGECKYWFLRKPWW